MSEGGGADVGLARVVVGHGDLRDDTRHTADAMQTVVGLQALVPELQRQVRRHDTQVGVAAALAVAVDGALDLDAALDQGLDAVGDGAARVIVRVDAKGDTQALGAGSRGLANLVGQAAAVGVAEDDPLGAAALGGPEGLQGIFAIGQIAVEEMLGIEEHPPPCSLQEGHRGLDHPQILLATAAQDVLHVQVPGFPEDGDDGSAAVYQGGELRVLLGSRADSAGAAEGGELRVLQRQVAGQLEELRVARVVGIRPPALDVVHAHLVEQHEHAALVLDAEGDALGLGSVAERCVVELYPRHVRALRRRAP